MISYRSEYVVISEVVYKAILQEAEKPSTSGHFVSTCSETIAAVRSPGSKQLQQISAKRNFPSMTFYKPALNSLAISKQSSTVKDVSPPNG
jgi:hypothetical protein